MQATNTHNNKSGRPEPEPLAVERKQAARMLGVSVALLDKNRYLNLPPRYRKIGSSVRYLISDLREFLDTCPSGGIGAPK